MACITPLATPWCLDTGSSERRCFDVALCPVEGGFKALSRVVFSGAGKDVSSFKATFSFQVFPKIEEDVVSGLFTGRYDVSVLGDILPENPCSSCPSSRPRAVLGAGAALWVTVAGLVYRRVEVNVEFHRF